MLARPQTSDVDPAQEGMDASQQVVRKLRRAVPKTRIIIRGDSGFSNNELMDFTKRPPWWITFSARQKTQGWKN